MKNPITGNELTNLHLVITTLIGAAFLFFLSVVFLTTGSKPDIEAQLHELTVACQSYMAESDYHTRVMQNSLNDEVRYQFVWEAGFLRNKPFSLERMEKQLGFKIDITPEGIVKAEG